MSSLLSSTLNTRALPTGTLRFIRSDAPVCPTREDVQWLMDHQITTLVDLRSAEEVLRKPSPLQHNPFFRYFHLPVTGGGDAPASREELHAVYRAMADEQMERIVDVILSAPAGVMYFCTAGKDRTGVVSAVLLRRLGVEDNVIVDDYMESKENLLEMLTAYAAKHPEAKLDVIVPQRENMERLLAAL